MIVGVGVDIIKVKRLRGVIDRHGDRFLDRVFTDEEVEYCRRCARPFERFATRFAAKEAVLKALGVGWQKGTRFLDVQVCNNELGAPAVELVERTLEISRELNVQTVHVSLSHDRDYGVAYAVAESP